MDNVHTLVQVQLSYHAGVQEVEVTGLDVLNAYSHTMRAAENASCAGQTRKRIHDLVAQESFGERFVTKVLGRHLRLS